jgi:hypothetical protein
LTNMSLTIRLLSRFLVFLVAFVKLLFLIIILFLSLIWTLGNEISILTIIEVYPLWPWLLFPFSFVRSSFLYECVKLLDK